MPETEQKPLDYEYIFHICGTLQEKILLIPCYYISRVLTSSVMFWRPYV
jgi:hypothetical protein